MSRTRKRIVIVLLMMALALSLVAWRTPTYARLSATAAEAASVVEQGGTFETDLFSVTLPDGWSTEGKKSGLLFTSDAITFKYQEGENLLLKLEILPTVGDVKAYRYQLRSFGFDLKEVAAGTAEQTFDVDGITFYYRLDESGKYSKYNAPDQVGKTHMVARIPSAGVTYEIESQVYTKYTEDVGPLLALLQNIKLTAPDQGLTDPPWPWEGTAIVPAASSTIKFSDLTATATWVPFAERYFPMDIYGWRTNIAVYQDTLYVLDRSAHDDFVLTAYELKDDKWVVKEDFEPVIIPHSAMQDGYGSTTLDVYGNLYLSKRFSGGGIVVSHTGEELGTLKLDQELRMAPSGTIGYSYNSGSDVNKVTHNKLNFTSEPWVLTGMKEGKADFRSIYGIDVTDDYVLVAGSDQETEEVYFAVYTHDGEKLHMFGTNDDGNLYWPVRMLVLDKGFVYMDKEETIRLWRTDGSFAGMFSLPEWLAIDGAILADCQLAANGQVWLAAEAMRADESGRELLIFKLDGLNEVVEIDPDLATGENPAAVDPAEETAQFRENLSDYLKNAMTILTDAGYEISLDESDASTWTKLGEDVSGALVATYVGGEQSNLFANFVVVETNDVDGAATFVQSVYDAFLGADGWLTSSKEFEVEEEKVTGDGYEMYHVTLHDTESEDVNVRIYLARKDKQAVLAMAGGEIDEIQNVVELVKALGFTP